MKKIKIFACACLCVVLIIANIYFVYEYNKKQILIKKNIYEITTSFPKRNDFYCSVNSYYMICVPKEKENELKEQVKRFIENNNTIEKLKSNIKEEQWSIHITFVKPTDSWPIGKFPKDGESFNVWTGMAIAGVDCSYEQPETYDICIYKYNLK